jgi:hypothetical protein
MCKCELSDAFAAEGHLQILKQLMPDLPFEIMFDIVPENADLSGKPRIL